MKSKGYVLVVEDDPAMRDTCMRLLARSGYEAEGVEDGEAALARLKAGPTPQIVVVDLRLPKKDGLAVLAEIRASNPDVSVVIMTGYATIKSAVNSIKLGAVDYIAKPFEKDDFLKVIDQQFRLRNLEHRVERLQSELLGRYCVENIVGRSQAMEAVFDRIAAASGSKANVLILGESGTGKELIARAIHYSGTSQNGPFVAVNCAALPASLIESELFGHAKGAFTGAGNASMGLFRAAHGGTIFLDEVFDIPPDVQAKLLRTIQERTVRPLGQTLEVPIDIRLIAASNQDPTQLLETGHLRQDLYYRLSVINIRVPSLRERREDIPLLIDHLVARFTRAYGFAIGPVGPEVMDLLVRYPWPGNIRELQNLVEQWFAMERRGRVTVADLPVAVARPSPTVVELPHPGTAMTPLHDAERTLAHRALEAAGGNKSKAASLLGISRKKLYRILREVSISKE